MDLLKLDVQGSELAIFQGGEEKLSGTVAIQTEVSFVPLYKKQPVLGDIDLELRGHGFIPHCFAALKKGSSRHASLITTRVRLSINYWRQISFMCGILDVLN